MANVIIRNAENRARNRCIEAAERRQDIADNPRGTSRYKTVGQRGSITVKEGTTKSGHKMTVLDDKEGLKDEREKQNFIKEQFGHNTTANGHGTVVRVSDAD